MSCGITAGRLSYLGQVNLEGMAEVYGVYLLVLHHIETTLDAEDEAFLFIFRIVNLENIKTGRNQGIPEVFTVPDQIDKPLGGPGQEAVLFGLLFDGDDFSSLFQGS